MNNRIDHQGKTRTQYERARKIIFAQQSRCAICGGSVDFKLKAPNPLSPSCDHIIPIALGGHPYDIDNLQLTHLGCNIKKSDKFIDIEKQKNKRVVNIIQGNRNLPQSVDWSSL